MAGSLSLEQVRHIARLARLQLSDTELELYRGQLSSVLEHIARLEEVNVEGVEPMAHPHDLTNRLDDDEPAASLSPGQVLGLAPSTEGEFIAVPRVLPDDEP